MKAQPFDRFAETYGLHLTLAQHVLTSLCFDGAAPADLGTTEHELAVELFDRIDDVPLTARTVVVWVKGARIGGSHMAALRLYQLALTVPLELGAGEDAYGLIVGPDMRLGRQLFGYALGAARLDAAAKRDGFAIVRETADSFTIERHDGVRVTIEVLPATRGGSAVRGRTLVGAVMTEAAHLHDDDFIVNDAEIYRALLIRIVDGGQLILESTPWVESGVLYELHRDNFGHPTAALVAECPTLTMRPDPKTRAKVEAERLRDPDNAENEYDAKFRHAGTSDFFEPATIDAAMTLTVAEAADARD